MFLKDKKVVVMGVANKKSIAWGCAKALKEQGADVIYTYQNERMKKQLLKLAEPTDLLVECDVASDESIAQAFKTIQEKYDKIDGLVHAIAFANKEELDGNVSDISRSGYLLAQDISSYSLLAVAHYAKPMLNPGSGIVTMTYLGSERAIPNYNMMGIAKASLETAVKYLAYEFAADKIRVNGISAGAIKTLAVTGVKDYDQLIKLSEDRTPDKAGVTIEEVGNTCAFLVSELAAGIVGDIIYVDKGVHLT
ncbi:enoyl-ACP reductase FabI [Enterococcus sp. DIV0242_7C1]|uniref:Enoyl-[acyl-carrier-protein] reductase [NADH] n=1 Tax=Candidatus Enterococcus dunnyi TaxID=1834192 RepID=A0A200J8E1_9ENTE|nr:MULTISPECIES: enoyl-ACP reductase FabI [unclassified Enterococcus]MBO0469879.1 enoyl-ACP reductase FabI [Enterococcus sp. DIV0242_7C1]MCA5012144.1 enoyl-ACP reductase FabI [Enterococcus sp. S23]MCA5015395.1 enoyl-ACP reductase FabI [Enterococcus sp. S22(2020)]OUZ32920.1 enoyl-[acyl-carrier-protein] reductase [NADH] FabI [Enterococcus sp. 9D6_DIV0238]